MMKLPWMNMFSLRLEAKFGHLRDLHRAIRLSRKALRWGTPSVQQIGQDLQIVTYEKPGARNVCAAFLINIRTTPATINFRGMDYYVPEKSIASYLTARL